MKTLFASSLATLAFATLALGACGDVPLNVPGLAYNYEGTLPPNSTPLNCSEITKASDWSCHIVTPEISCQGDACETTGVTEKSVDITVPGVTLVAQSVSDQPNRYQILEHCSVTLSGMGLPSSMYPDINEKITKGEASYVVLTTGNTWVIKLDSLGTTCTRSAK